MKLKKIGSIVWAVLLATLLCHGTYAQKTFSVTIEISPLLVKEKLKVSYDTRIEEVEVKPVFKGNRIIISGAYYSRYASLEIEYPSKQGGWHEANFFLTDAPATISFLGASSDKDPLGKFKAKYAYTHESMGRGELIKYTATEQKDAITFLEAHKDEMNDSLLTLAREKFDRWEDKNIEFITLNPELYYNFWFFRTGIVYDYKIGSDSLFTLFALFPDSLKNSREGERVVEILRSSKLKKGQLIPDFTIEDTTGRTFSLSDYRGKYVLLDFWASWCGPCVAEMSTIMEVRKNFPEEKLAMVFISSDDDTSAFQGAVKKYDIQGKHAFLTQKMMRQYSIQAIPVLYVIDPEGQVIYSLYEEQDNLKSLNKVLADRL
ncbi:TlpA family protein disulfide reductase [Salmonirosea aquatica]|uniref:Redoxin domain-containing protein n=1 Tax=Salmonirosea aquatica TaxID=2654236 RepID=A0A7C9BDQ0_9BACT|nr:redoxin domain-containing protein [Cytophagaceae bacterium SJW1-29]